MFERLYSSKGLSRGLVLRGDIPDTKNLYKSFLKMAWPAMIESILMSLVNLVDTMMVANCGTNAVSAVGLTTQPRMIFYSVFFALNIAVTAIVSRRNGQNDREGANACLAQSMGLVAVLGALLCGTAVLNADFLIKLAGSEPVTHDDATIYFRITMIGLIFTSFGMIINGAQRGCGNTKLSMRTNIVANITNIIFNALLINGIWIFPEMGVTGAAIATLIGNIASFVMSLSSLFIKDSFLHFNLEGMIRWRAPLLKTVGKVALGASAEQVFMRIGFLIYSIIIAKLGTADFATHTICMSILTLSFAGGDGLSVAASALMGQNLGKKRSDLAALFVKAGQRIGLIISLILMLVFIFGGGFILELFADPTDINYDYVMSVGRILTYIIAIVSPSQISQVIYNGALRGAGDTKFVAITSAISIGFFRPVVALLLCNPNGLIPFYTGIGIYGAWISLLVDQVIRLGISAVRFKGGKWERISI